MSSPNKSCPFCGGNELHITERERGQMGWHFSRTIMCDSPECRCHVTDKFHIGKTDQESKEHLLKLWNTRYDQDDNKNRLP